MTILLMGLALAPGVAWFHGPWLLVLALGAWRLPHRGWHAAAAGVLLVGALRGSWGQPIALGCLLGLVALVRARREVWRAEVPRMEDLAPARVAARTRVLADDLAHDRTSVSATPASFLAILSAGAAILVLPQVWPTPLDGDVVGPLARALLASGGALAAAELLPAPSLPTRALWLGGLVPLLRLGAMFRLQGEALVGEAEGLQAVPLVYPRLATRADPALLSALVRAMPERDEAALALGWDAALAAGWKPRTAAGVEIPVARALVERGRAGEGFALLKALPREGSVDWELALMERVAGKPVGWLGGRVAGPIVPGEVLLQRTLAGDGELDVEFTALSACRGARVQVAPEGPGAAVLELRVDGEEPGKLRLEDAAAVLLADELSPGPHRLRLRLVGEPSLEGGRPSLKLSRLLCEA